MHKLKCSQFSESQTAKLKCSEIKVFYSKQVSELGLMPHRHIIVCFEL